MFVNSKAISRGKLVYCFIRISTTIINEQVQTFLSWRCDASNKVGAHFEGPGTNHSFGNPSLAGFEE